MISVIGSTLALPAQEYLSKFRRAQWYESCQASELIKIQPVCAQPGAPNDFLMQHSLGSLLRSCVIVLPYVAFGVSQSCCIPVWERLAATGQWQQGSQLNQDGQKSLGCASDTSRLRSGSNQTRGTERLNGDTPCVSLCPRLYKILH